MRLLCVNSNNHPLFIVNQAMDQIEKLEIDDGFTGDLDTALDELRHTDGSIENIRIAMLHVLNAKNGIDDLQLLKKLKVNL